MARELYRSIIYQDTGCSLAPKCLSCPFPECFQDEGDKVQVWLRQQRARVRREHARALVSEMELNRWTVKQAADARQCSIRTIYLLKTLAVGRIEGDPE